MNPARAMLKVVSVIRWAEVIRFPKISGFVAILALVLALGSPSPCSAQTLSLGQAGNYDAFGAYNSSTNAAATFYSFSSSTDGNVGLASNGASLNGLTTGLNVGGTVFLQGNSAFNNGTAGLVVTGANLTQANNDALAANHTASSWNASNSNILSMSQSGNNYSVTGLSSHSGQNIINITGALGGSGNYTLNISGSGQFLFNLSAGASLTDFTVVLNGVSASNVFFNTKGNGVGIGGSTIYGNILNMNGGSMSLDSDVIHGSVVSDGFIDMAGTIIAPELPTIMMAGIACLFLLGKVGLDCRRKLTARTASPQP
jgi:hypothetical protein